MSNQRYLLYIDILGFTNLVETKSADEIYKIIDDALQNFSRWEMLNKQFRTIYFSDTFLFYQNIAGYGDWAFLDVYAIGSMLLSALLANGIPARGAISFGEFNVRFDGSSRHQVYFGRALIDAYKAELREKWIGIIILESAWSQYEARNPGRIDVHVKDRTWLKRNDNVLLLNPFLRLTGYYSDDLIGEIDRPYLQWDAPEFPNDILGFKFLREQAAKYVTMNNYSGDIAIKYHSTLNFLKNILGDEIYDWGVRISEQHNQ